MWDWFCSGSHNYQKCQAWGNYIRRNWPLRRILSLILAKRPGPPCILNRFEQQHVCYSLIKSSSNKSAISSVKSMLKLGQGFWWRSDVGGSSDVLDSSSSGGSSPQLLIPCSLLSRPVLAQKTNLQESITCAIGRYFSAGSQAASPQSCSCTLISTNSFLRVQVSIQLHQNFAIFLPHQCPQAFPWESLILAGVVFRSENQICKSTWSFCDLVAIIMLPYLLHSAPFLSVSAVQKLLHWR